jgi:hypothetical protein
MVKKKIRKFFNSVSVCDCMPMMFEEQKKKHFSFLWVALGAACTLCAAVAVLFFVMKDAEQKKS